MLTESFGWNSGSIFNPLDLTSPIRIYVYDLPSKFNDDWLSDERCSNHLFASEVAIHKNLLASPIRTIDPYKADFFFVPVYVSCKFSPKTGFPWLGHAPRTLQAAVNFVSTRMEFWNRSEGRDHVFVAAHDYGACFHSLVRLIFSLGPLKVDIGNSVKMHEVLTYRKSPKLKMSQLLNSIVVVGFHCNEGHL